MIPLSDHDQENNRHLHAQLFDGPDCREGTDESGESNLLLGTWSGKEIESERDN